ncbi:hypothetical protein [Winogradskyella sp. MIT101101]|uniref:hypothetical protein n=1 Tax=Winogradskyella sp. MIT101101 TaxID=3098297 RepID=UPI00399BC5B4
MKTLKITLALVAIAMLTVSGVQSDQNDYVDTKTIKQETKINLIAHGKVKKLKMPSQG